MNVNMDENWNCIINEIPNKIIKKDAQWVKQIPVVSHASSGLHLGLTSGFAIHFDNYDAQGHDLTPKYIKRHSMEFLNTTDEKIVASCSGAIGACAIPLEKTITQLQYSITSGEIHILVTKCSESNGFCQIVVFRYYGND